MLRRDFRKMIVSAREFGFSYYVMPSASPLLSGEFMDFLLQNRASGVIMSMDGAYPEIHDGIRRSRGSLDLTIYLLKESMKQGLRTIVSTTIMKENMMNLPDMAMTLHDLEIKDWVLIFLVNAGRAASMENISEDQKCAIDLWARSLVSYGFNVRLINSLKPDRHNVLSVSRLNSDGKGIYRALMKRTSELICHRSSQVRRRTASKDEETEIYISQNGTVYDSIFNGERLGDIRKEEIGRIIARVLNNESAVA